MKRYSYIFFRSISYSFMEALTKETLGCQLAFIFTIGYLQKSYPDIQIIRIKVLTYRFQITICMFHAFSSRNNPLFTSSTQLLKTNHVQKSSLTFHYTNSIHWDINRLSTLVCFNLLWWVNIQRSRFNEFAPLIIQISLHISNAVH